ncbi:MAG TPA: hypothetical protein VGP82_05360 [Ktedonobacterales bacterium]|jgi:uncharacterized membrane protein HdeD (DUF308 family)|nr:hypothetical protein [Ktedonobacterales bacterium]
MITVARTWWAAVLRGAAALALALIVVVYAHGPATGAPLLFGTYVLVDGLIAVGGVLAAGLGRHGALLLTEGLTGITIGMASIYEPHAMPFTTPLFMIAWALVIGSAEIFTGGQIGQEMPNFRESPPLDRRLRRRTLAPNRAYLLSGAIALAFAVALAVVPIFRTTLAIPLLGLFAASFGYLHLCAGLILGLHVVERSSYEVVTAAVEGDLGATTEGAL